MVKVISLSLLISLFCVTSVHLIFEIDEILDGKLNRLHSFEQWQKIYGKSYSPEEKILRKKIFDEGTAAIIEHNKRYQKGEVTFFLGQNKFSDLTNDEFKHRMVNHSFKNFNHTKKAKKSTKSRGKRQVLPTSIDYRSWNAIAPVQDQGICGSCYAFAETGAVESQIYLNGGPLIKLSEQEIVDCSRKDGNFNCRGGFSVNVYKYMINKGALNPSSAYPYTSKSTGVEGTCYTPYATKLRYKVDDYDDYFYDEIDIQYGLVNNGPMTAALNVANSQSFQFYAGGVWSDSNCSNDPYDSDHEMLIVGYGTSNYNEDYWIVKNSWSRSWGSSGFVRIRRGVNQCGISNWSNYPIVSGF